MLRRISSCRRHIYVLYQQRIPKEFNSLVYECLTMDVLLDPSEGRCFPALAALLDPAMVISLSSLSRYFTLAYNTVEHQYYLPRQHSLAYHYCTYVVYSSVYTNPFQRLSVSPMICSSSKSHPFPNYLLVILLIQSDICCFTFFPSPHRRFIKENWSYRSYSHVLTSCW